MLITQSVEELQAATQLHLNSAIQSIRLSSSRCRSVNFDQLKSLEQIETRVGFKPTTAVTDGEKLTLTIEFTFTAQSLTTEGKKKPTEVMGIHCELEACYNLKPGFSPTETQIAAFHKGNAVFNSWPFFREFVQNSAVRMEIPPPPIPFLRISSPPKPKQEGVQAPTKRSLRHGPKEKVGQR